jgi:transcriptional regulator
MAQNSFATLISASDGEPVASHLPLLVERFSAPHGLLRGHMARANSQWAAADGNHVLAIFHGPHSYISPSWYEDTGVVPTWNYVAVHAYGTLRVDRDRGRLRDQLGQLVGRYESNQTNPWSIESQDAEFIDRLMNAIVGFEIVLDRVEGKWKLNQNHSRERRLKVIRALRQMSDDNARLIADWMNDLERDSR